MGPDQQGTLWDWHGVPARIHLRAWALWDGVPLTPLHILFPDMISFFCQIWNTNVDRKWNGERVHEWQKSRFSRAPQSKFLVWLTLSRGAAPSPDSPGGWLRIQYFLVEHVDYWGRGFGWFVIAPYLHTYIQKRNLVSVLSLELGSNPGHQNIHQSIARFDVRRKQKSKARQGRPNGWKMALWFTHYCVLRDAAHGLIPPFLGKSSFWLPRSF